MAEKENKLGIMNNDKLSKTVFRTLVNVRQIQSKETGKWITKITLGEKQNLTMIVTDRKDQKGTCLLGDLKGFKLSDLKKEMKVEKL